MNASFPVTSSPLQTSSASETIVLRSVSSVQPWRPLDQVIAVNPFEGFASLPVPEASARLSRVGGPSVLLPLRDLLAMVREGKVTESMVAEAASERGLSFETVWKFVKSTDEVETGKPLLTVAGLADELLPRGHWQASLCDELSKFCCAYFDTGHALWPSPWKGLGLWKAWRQHQQNDRAFAVLGLRDYAPLLELLPDDPLQAAAVCLAELRPTVAQQEDYALALIQTVRGWCSYASYKSAEAGTPAGASDALAVFAIRISCDLALYRTLSGDPSFRASWRHNQASTPGVSIETLRECLQWAYEGSLQRQISKAMLGASRDPSAPAESLMVFCIDVRSERFRRHLETLAPGVRTRGAAGHFGLNLLFRDPAKPEASLRAPAGSSAVALCHPADFATSEAKGHQARREWGAFKAFQVSVASCFSFVETLGLSYVPSLALQKGVAKPRCASVPPVLSETTDLATRLSLAKAALSCLGPVEQLPPLVIFCGHRSESLNNPHASALECGACGGNPGDVNSRVAASLLNDPLIRSELEKSGIRIPATTVFLGAVHQTVTDEVLLFDSAPLEPQPREILERLRLSLAEAAKLSRAERSERGFPSKSVYLDAARRAVDPAVVRPEMGLTGNHAMVLAPRTFTKDLNLSGRVFLLDYHVASDPNGALLGALLSGVVPVVAGINLQYHASTLNPERESAGNKVLHNVVGGFGVLEGNGGDLRVGLPEQTLRAPSGVCHEARRLTLHVVASRTVVEKALQASPAISTLIENHWIHLVALEEGASYLRSEKGWATFATQA